MRRPAFVCQPQDTRAVGQPIPPSTIIRSPFQGLDTLIAAADSDQVEPTSLRLLMQGPTMADGFVHSFFR